MKSIAHAGKVSQFSHVSTVSPLGETLAEHESVKLNKLQFQHPAWAPVTGMWTRKGILKSAETHPASRGVGSPMATTLCGKEKQL